MRIILSFAAAVLLTFTACEPKHPEETSTPASETMEEEATTATDIAETTAAPIDTAGFSQDSLVLDK